MLLRKNIYPLLIITLLGSFLGFSLWSAMQAAERGPQIADADYYSKGLKYSSTLVERKAAESLGWTVSTQLTDGKLNFLLSDKQGEPVLAAQGVLYLYLAKSATSRHFPLKDMGKGIYQLQLTKDMSGEMAARLEFDRHGAHLNRQLLLNL